MLGNLPADVSVSKRTVFRARSSRKNVSFEDLILNVQGHISVHILVPKWRLLFLLTLKYFSQHSQTFKPITIEEIVIFMIIVVIVKLRDCQDTNQDVTSALISRVSLIILVQPLRTLILLNRFSGFNELRKDLL